MRKYCSEQTKLAWLPAPEQFSTPERNTWITSFIFNRTLKIRKNSVSRSENITKVMESYAADLKHEVSREEIMTSKHFLLGFEIHKIKQLSQWKS